MSLTLLMVMALSMAKDDPLETARQSLNTCLASYTNAKLDAETSSSEFTKSIAAACTKEQSELKALVIKVEMQYGDKRDEAESYAAEEIQMIIDSYTGSYGEYLSSKTRHGNI